MLSEVMRRIKPVARSGMRVPVERDHGFRGKLITESGDRDQPGKMV
jgi:hypothetical protein